MNRKAFSILAASAAMLVFTFSSCKKSDDTQSRKSMLTGQWALSQMGTDANRNGIPDNGEMVTAATVGQSAQVSFRSDMSYTLVYTGTGTVDTFNGTWGLMTGDVVIRTVYHINSGSVADTSNLKIYTLSSNSLTVLDESDTAHHIWETFVK